MLNNTSDWNFKAESLLHNLLPQQNHNIIDEETEIIQLLKPIKDKINEIQLEKGPITLLACVLEIFYDHKKKMLSKKEIIEGVKNKIDTNNYIITLFKNPYILYLDSTNLYSKINQICNNPDCFERLNNEKDYIKLNNKKIGKILPSINKELIEQYNIMNFKPSVSIEIDEENKPGGVNSNHRHINNNPNNSTNSFNTNNNYMIYNNNINQNLANNNNNNLENNLFHNNINNNAIKNNIYNNNIYNNSIKSNKINSVKNIASNNIFNNNNNNNNNNSIQNNSSININNNSINNINTVNKININKKNIKKIDKTKKKNEEKKYKKYIKNESLLQKKKKLTKNNSFIMTSFDNEANISHNNSVVTSFSNLSIESLSFSYIPKKEEKDSLDRIINFISNKNSKFISMFGGENIKEREAKKIRDLNQEISQKKIEIKLREYILECWNNSNYNAEKEKNNLSLIDKINEEIRNDYKRLIEEMEVLYALHFIISKRGGLKKEQNNNLEGIKNDFILSFNVCIDFLKKINNNKNKYLLCLKKINEFIQNVNTINLSIKEDKKEEDNNNKNNNNILLYKEERENIEKVEECLEAFEDLIKNNIYKCLLNTPFEKLLKEKNFKDELFIINK